jgi:hypothetical protein
MKIPSISQKKTEESKTQQTLDFTRSRGPKLEITAGVERITPSIAKNLLETNVDNRKLRDGRVLAYADAMRRGQWQVTNDAIVVSETGILLNGQHRLTAVVASGLPYVDMLVSRGNANTAFTVIDTGLGRKTSDALHSAGMTQGSHFASVGRLLYAIENDVNIFNTEMVKLITNDDILQYVLQNEEVLTWAIRKGDIVNQSIGGIKTAWATFAVLAANKYGVERVELFLDAVASGNDLKKDDPRLALRNFLARTRSQYKSAQQSRLNIPVFIKTFNTWNQGGKLSVIRQFVRGSEFPEIL